MVMVAKLVTYLAASATRAILCLSPAISIRFMLSLSEAQIYAVSMLIIRFAGWIRRQQSNVVFSETAPFVTHSSAVPGRMLYLPFPLWIFLLYLWKVESCLVSGKVGECNDKTRYDHSPKYQGQPTQPIHLYDVSILALNPSLKPEFIG